MLVVSEKIVEGFIRSVYTIAIALAGECRFWRDQALCAPAAQGVGKYLRVIKTDSAPNWLATRANQL